MYMYYAYMITVSFNIIIVNNITTHTVDGCVYAVKKSLKPVAGSADE